MLQAAISPTIDTKWEPTLEYALSFQPVQESLGKYLLLEEFSALFRRSKRIHTLWPSAILPKPEVAKARFLEHIIKKESSSWRVHPSLCKDEEVAKASLAVAHTFLGQAEFEKVWQDVQAGIRGQPIQQMVSDFHNTLTKSEPIPPGISRTVALMKRFPDDEEIAHAVLGLDGLALQYASERIRKTLSVVYVAVRNNGAATKYSLVKECSFLVTKDFARPGRFSVRLCWATAKPLVRTRPPRAVQGATGLPGSEASLLSSSAP